MEELWQKAVETAIDGRARDSPITTLTLDGAVRCLNGRLPPPDLLEKFPALEHLSIANIGLTTLDMFPRLWNLRSLILSDNQISGGLECLVEAGLRSLRDLDLSNNLIQNVEDLTPLAELGLVSLDLFECPVAGVQNYRFRIFGLIKSLKYLDRLDVDGSDDDEVDDNKEEDDGVIDGEGLSFEDNKGSGSGDGVIDEDEGDASDGDGIEEERDAFGAANSLSSNDILHHGVNGPRMLERDGVVGEDEVAVDEELAGVEEDGSGSESEDGDVIMEGHEIEDGDEEVEGVEDEGGDDHAREVEDVEPGTSGRVICNGGEIDGHEQGEEEDTDNDGEYEEVNGEYEEPEFRVQIAQQARDNGEGRDFDPQIVLDGGDDTEVEEIEDEDLSKGEVDLQPCTSSHFHMKRKRQGDTDDNDEDDSVEDGLLKPQMI